MTPEEKLSTLLHYVRKMRKYQKSWEVYHASVDKPLKVKWERMVDSLLTDEIKKEKSKQQEIL